MLKRTVSIILTGAMLSSTVALADKPVKINENEKNDTAFAVGIDIPYKNCIAVLTVKEAGDDYIIAETEEKRQISLNISADTVLIDSETALPIELGEIEKGTEISVEYSSEMTKSIPPQTNAYLVAVNVQKGGAVNLIHADSVEADTEGNIYVTDNSRDVIVRIEKDASITPYKTKNIIKLADITEGCELLAWYDAVGMSIPAKAYSEKVVLLGEKLVSDEVEKVEQDKQDDVQVEDGGEQAAETTYKALMTIKEIDDDYIMVQNGDEPEICLNISDETVIIDSKTGVAVEAYELDEEEEILVVYSSYMTRSLPPQTNAYLIATNTQEGGLVNLIHADSVKTDDNGDVYVTDNSRDVIVRIAKNASVAPYRTRNIVKLDDVYEGVDLLAWYDVEAQSLPAQAYTEKIVILGEKFVSEDEDNAPSDWAKDEIENAGHEGIFEGLKIFWKNNINRLDFCEMVYNILNKKGFIKAEGKVEIVFGDSDNKKINILASMGIISGKGDGRFAPDDLLTREEAAAVISRIADMVNVKENDDTDKRDDFEDDKEISGWAKKSVYKLKKLKIMQGSEKGFEPKAQLTSEQATATLMRLYTLIGR